MINENNVLKIENLTLTEEEIKICKLISSHTNNTWQINRSEEEKLRDTCLGKFAEKALKEYFSYDSFNNFNPFIAFYDDFRIDQFKYHNSIDFIFSDNLQMLLSAQRYIQENLSHSNSKLSSIDKEKFKKGKVHIGEIKATRITNRFLKNENVDINLILKDDFLTYPFFKRSSSTIFNNQDYFNEIIKKNNQMNIESILKQEENNLTDWYFRIYIKETKEINSCEAYIIGAIPGIDFISNFNIKKMLQKGKSESSLYLSVPLKNGISIEEFKNNHISILDYPNHITTALNSNLNPTLFKSNKLKM